MKIYTSGPMRQTSKRQCLGWRQSLIKKYPQHKFLDPTRHNIPDNDILRYSARIVANDLADIREADAVLANVWKYSAGTSMEIGFAFTSGKIVVIVAPETFHDDVWLQEHSHFMTTRLHDGMQFLEEAFEKGYVPTATHRLPRH